jgi:hypothetical protein
MGSEKGWCSVAGRGISTMEKLSRIVGGVTSDVGRENIILTSSIWRKS